VRRTNDGLPVAHEDGHAPLVVETARPFTPHPWPRRPWIAMTLAVPIWASHENTMLNPATTCISPN
jgi:hypothetical protein